MLSIWGHAEVAEEFIEVPNPCSLELGNCSLGSIRTEGNRRSFPRAMSPADWNLTAYTGPYSEVRSFTSANSLVLEVMRNQAPGSNLLYLPSILDGSITKSTAVFAGSIRTEQ